MPRKREDGPETLMHGTSVALGEDAALLRGPSGAGKSDLALRFITVFAEDGACLVSDDQTRLALKGGHVVVSAPDAIAGLLEVRGLGPVAMTARGGARLRLIVDLVAPADVPRLPPEPAPRETVLGRQVPLMRLAPFEASAAVKLKLALESHDS